MNTFDSALIDSSITFHQRTLVASGATNQPGPLVQLLRSRAGSFVIRLGEHLRGSSNMQPVATHRLVVS